MGYSIPHFCVPSAFREPIQAQQRHRQAFHRDISAKNLLIAVCPALMIKGVREAKCPTLNTLIT